jgi:hypothetical protein
MACLTVTLSTTGCCLLFSAERIFTFDNGVLNNIARKTRNAGHRTSYHFIAGITQNAMPGWD